MTTCDCELRNRQWDPLSGRCLTCRRYYVDERDAKKEREAQSNLEAMGLHKAPNETAVEAMQSADTFFSPAQKELLEALETATSDNLGPRITLDSIAPGQEDFVAAAMRANDPPPKTWSIVADKMGGHWHATVRRGVEGSRARLGELTFDLSDAEAFQADVGDIVDRVVTRTISSTIEQLGKHNVFAYGTSGGALATFALLIGEDLRPAARSQVTEQLVNRFGVRVDLAKVR